MDYDRIASLPRLFFDQAAGLGDKPLTYRRSEGQWRPGSWGVTAAFVRALAGFLIARGVEPGDRVALVAENRPEWLIADLAIMTAGAVTVPAFSTNTTEDHRHILTHSGAKGVIYSGGTIASRLLPAAFQAPELKFTIAMDAQDKAAQMPFQQWDWMEAMAAQSQTAEIERRLGMQKRSDTCCIIYTSGTGGTPKGVMLSHGSILCNIKGAYKLLLDVGLGNDRFLSFLPLSHSYEHTAGQFLPISIGAEIWYAESIERLVDNMAEVRPTIMTAVPRLYEAVHAKILRGLSKAPKVRQELFWLAYRLGRKAYEQPGSLSIAETWLDKLCNVLVRKKVQQRFGGHLKAFVSGGAALNYEIGVFFLALGVRLLQGYGQTEASPVISANMPSKIKIDTVGPIFDGLTARIAEDGEILVKGEAVMSGYWRDPESSAKAVVDGWLHTGDIGEFDADGYLKITDRKKDIIVLSGGDNVSPARVEGFLVLQPEIAQAMVHGDKHPHLVALVVPDEEFAREWAAKNGSDGGLAMLADNAIFHKVLGSVIDRVNASLSPLEKIRRYTLLPEGFTIDNGMLTPSMKIKRHKIRDKWGAAIARMYERS
ncbi:long-chain fatty acid--CoA ligase [Dongia sp.]|uniref:AMP-dependent synthetase/ligase n=1 Tax=Dongia sp. TaxID=1977262 RepID=UPI0035AF940E